MQLSAKQTTVLDDSLLDSAVLADIKDLMGDGLPALVEKFVMLSEGYVVNILYAIAERDVSKVHENAHPLKSSSQQLSAYQLSLLARIIEDEARQSKAITPAMRDAALQLQDVLEQSAAALRQALKI